MKKKKILHEITPQEVEDICKMANQSYRRHMFITRDNTTLMITCTSTANGDKADTTLSICDTGEMYLMENDGKFVNCRLKIFNQLPVFDFLRSSGYAFTY